MDQTQKQQDDQESGGASGFLGDLMDIGEAAVMTIFLFLLIFAYLLRPVTVDGSSMVPTLYDQDQLLILTTLSQPKPGNIVVINDEKAGLFADDAETVVYPTHGLGIVIVKRLIAEGGQEVNVDAVNGTVSVDGVQLQEDYINDLTMRDDGAFTYPFTVPEGYLFVMGDNRMNSTDSRNPNVGLVPAEQVMGVAFVRFDRDESHCKKWTDRFALLL